MSHLLQNRLTRRAGLAFATAFVAAAGSTSILAREAASTPASSTDCACGSTLPAQDAATPAASPVAAASELPEGALGDRIQWLLDLINGDQNAITAEALTPEFAGEMLEVVAIEDLAAVIAEVAIVAAPLTMQSGQIAVLPETPPKTAVFRADGRDGVVVQITISVDPETGQVTGLAFKPLGFTLDTPAAATPAA